MKGAPAPNTTPQEVALSAIAHPPPHNANDRLTALKNPRSLQDPTSLLPSSPPQIYLNLLILEASLRSQYLTLRARRRQNTFVLTLLAIWILFFTYLLWLRPREDGKGIGGSQYWLIDMSQKLCFITGMVTLLLFWATGQWERGVRWPRRWIGIANRGLRGMNAKIVVIRGPWWQELASWLVFMRPFSGGLWGGETGGSSYHFISLAHEKGASKREHHHTDSAADTAFSAGRPRHRIIGEDGKEYAEEDIAPGGDYIKLLLLPKPFTPDFRAGWEVFRQEYWERENERRRGLRLRVKARQKEIARLEGGWLWWTGWRGWKRARGSKPGDLERTAHHHSHSHSHVHGVAMKDRKRRPSVLRDRDREASAQSTHSRSSSRSSSHTADIDDRLRSGHERDRERRWSTSTAGSTATTSTMRPDSRRGKKTSSSSITTSGTAQSARQGPVRPALGGRPGTPNDSSGSIPKRASLLRDGSAVDEREEEGSRPRSRDGEGFVFPNAPSA